MEIAFYNEKGGCGKTLIATQLALYFDTTIIELDPYGVLTKTLGNERVIKISLDEPLPELVSGDVVYDFGGFADARIKQNNDLDLIIIPFLPTVVSLGTTVESYRRIENLQTPKLFVVNGAINEEDVKDAIDYLEEELKTDITYFVIPHTRALQTAENNSLCILELAKQGGIKGYTYKKIATIFQDFFNTVQTIVQKG